MSRLRRPGPAGLYVGRVDLQAIGVPHHRLSEAVILRRCGQEGRRNEKHGEKEPGEEEPGKDELHGGLSAGRPFKGRLTEALLVARGVTPLVGPSTLVRAGLRSVRILRRRPAPYGAGPRGLWAVLLLGMLAIPATVSRAARPAAPYSPARGEAGAVNLQAEVGWAGWIPLRAWLPVLVYLQVSMPVDGEIVVEVPVQGYDAPLSFRRPVRLLPGAPQRIAVDVFVPDARRALTVRLVASGREVTRREVPLSASRAVEAVVLALTHEPAGLEFLADLTRKIRAAYITEVDLPVQWQGYAGGPLLIVRDLDERAVSPAQQRALEQWVVQGGRLLVTGGAPLVVLRAPWLLRMLPADPAGLTEVRRPDVLPGLRGPISATMLKLRRGAAGGPMGGRWRWGTGSVLVWAFDPFAPELRSWSGRAAIWGGALDAPVRPWVATAEIGSALPSSRPLAGAIQLWVARLSIVYVVAVRRVLRHAGRVRGGWLAVPGVAVCFMTVMYGFALQARRAGTSVVQASIAEVIPGTGMARVRTFASLISPYGGAFQLKMADDVWIHPVEPRPLTFDAPSAISGSAPASGLRVDAAQVVSMPLTGRTAVSDAGLRVEIDNRGALNITDAQIFRGGQVYRLPRIGATLSTLLDPTRWEPFGRQPNPPPDVGDRFMEEVLGRLQRQPSSPDGVAWLVGRLGDGQPAAGQSIRGNASRVG